jgi:uncharacterized protein (DUF427 family)
MTAPFSRPAHLRTRGPHLPPLDGIVQYDFAPGYVVFTLPCPKRVRVFAGGHLLADSIRVLTLFESDHIPIYYFPLADIRMDLLEPGTRVTQSPYKGTARHYSLTGGGSKYADIMWQYDRPIPACPDISGHASFYWHHVDRWFEEEEEVFVHVRDPFRRVECLPTSRRVTVDVAGERVADSARGVFLFETSLPVRHYLPRQDIRMEFLEPSDTRTCCPYKGEAQYFHLRVGGRLLKNAVWTYANPVHESARIAGLLAFAGELTGGIAVDGIEVPQPVTSLVHGYNYHGYHED